MNSDQVGATVASSVTVTYDNETEQFKTALIIKEVWNEAYEPLMKLFEDIHSRLKGKLVERKKYYELRSTGYNWIIGSLIPLIIFTIVVVWIRNKALIIIAFIFFSITFAVGLHRVFTNYNNIRSLGGEIRSEIARLMEGHNSTLAAFNVWARMEDDSDLKEVGVSSYEGYRTQIPYFGEINIEITRLSAS